MWEALCDGKNTVLFGTGPFASADMSWQIALAGRTNGHLATVDADHPLMEDFPHDGYCGRQFESMLNNSKAVILDLTDIVHRPVLDAASSYKNACREGMLFEYRAGKLLVCSLNLTEEDPAACWLKNRILSYAAGDRFMPEQTISETQFVKLCVTPPIMAEKNANEAMNINDITMQ